jgi:amino acid transporter
VVAIYVAMSTVMIGIIPWQEAKDSPVIASLFIQRTFSHPDLGRLAAIVMTALILFVTASSLYAVILGYSRIPFAAAREGQFFRVFERVHPTKHFPHVSLLTLGALAIPLCFFTLGDLVNWLMQIQIVTQFIWQCAAVILLRRYRKDIPQPFTMWLYPIPALVALLLWAYVFVSSPPRGQAIAGVFLAAAVAAFFVFERQLVRRVGNDDAV